MVKPTSQRARHANQLHPRHIRRKAAAVAVAACFTSGIAMANPTAPTVVHGTATMSQAGGILNITNSHNAIINWGSFSIGVNELTRFIQPSALSAVLNRVVGSDPSAILGSLQSNGRVFLINPNGIMFGSGAQINVAGLVASTLNISNDDFLNNRMRFTDGALAGGVVNQGNITGGSVYLIGNAVANKGLITSPNGEVVLAAGNSVELVNPGTPNLRVEVVAPANEARNLGTISAEAGRVGIYAGLIKQGGTISADSAVAEGGRIMLKSTRRTDLETSSVISARGRDGGRIEVLSDMASGQTNVEGVLNASALGDAGRGGFVETSAASVNVGASTTVNTTGSAASGRWMIDPEDFVISAGSASQTSSGIGADTLATNLATTPVEIYTAAYGGGIGNILVNSPVVWNSANGLYLYAHGDIIVAQTLANAGTGDIALLAGWNGNPFASFPVSGSGNINVNAPVTSGGTIFLFSGNSITQNSAGTLTAPQLNARTLAGSINLTAASNNVGTIAGTATGQFAFKNTGNLTVGTVGGTSGITAYGGSPGLHVTVDVDVTGGALTVANPIVAVGLGGSGGAAGGNANISLTASNGITVNSNLTATAGHGGSAFYGGTPGNGGLATISLTNTGAGSSVVINSSAGSVIANGGGGGDGSGFYGGGVGGAIGGNGTINVTSAGGILVEASVQASGGHGGSGSNAFGGNAGNGTVNMNANGGDLTIVAYGGVAAYGGIGGYGNNGNGGRGGDASLNLSASGGLTVTGTARAFGGFGGSGSSGAGGRGGDALVNLTAGTALIIDSMQNFAVKADGGEGGVGEWDGNGGRGGDGTINLTSGGAMSLGNSSVSYFDAVYASGGNGGYVDGGEGFTGGTGGQAKVEVTSAGGITVNGGIEARGGNGGYDYSFSGSRGNGGEGKIVLNNTSPSAGIVLNSYAYVDAEGGEGATGGAAVITMNSASTILIGMNGSIQADGGEMMGYDGIAGGAATIDVVASGAIVVNAGGSVDAVGGGAYYGGNGGNAAVKLTSTGSSITISGSAEVEARGGDVNSFYSSGNGGQATIEITSAGNTSVSDFSYVQAYGGDGGEGGVGGAAAVVISAGGGIFVSDSVVESYGGDAGSFGQGGAASVGLFASGPIQIEGGEGGNYIRAYGGYGENGGNAAINVISGGSILLSGGGMSARYDDGEFEGVASIVVAAAGNLTLQNEAYLDSEGMVGLGGANILLDMAYAYGETGVQVDASGSLSVINNSFLGGPGIASITTGGNVLVETNGWITGYPDVTMKVGGEVFINTGGRIEAGLPTTIYLTFPMLTSGGFTVNGVPGVLFDGSTGFFAGGSGAVLGTNLLVTYGGGATLNVPPDTLIVAMSESIKPPDAEKKKDIFEDENDAKKKKETASCR